MKTGFWRVWRVPVAVGALTLAGLLSALLGDGIWDWISAVTLGVPVVLCIWYGMLRR